MELPFITYNSDLLATVAPQLEAELAEQLAQRNFSEQAKGILKQLLAGQRPGIDDLARELHMSIRTLQRRLTEQAYHSAFAEEPVVNWPITTCSTRRVS